ncbi:hypothetical protein NC651_036874 [Populus alba x Populus x berolinensis]|nr:hypothetical protein NC651_036874 [Populus alba x Populus x berolinensis]
MAESEKLVALKKAYADIILNTAKEAASRVMESERKGLRYHHDLCSSKDEALRLLLRLKQMIDAKAIEAEITSASQQSKIDELEAQLQEAEGVIIDLRAELRWVRDELEKVRNSKVQPSNVEAVKESESSHQHLTSEPIVLSLSNLPPQTVATSNVKSTLLDQRNFNKCCNTEDQQLSVSPLENYSSRNADLASITMANKEPELYRNGCTQRIRASEGNAFASKLPPSDVGVEQQSLIKNEVIVKASNGDEGKCTETSPKTKNVGKMNFSGEEVRNHVKVCSSRQKRGRFAKAKAKRKSCPIVRKPYQPPSIVSRRKTNSVNGTVKSDQHLCTLPPVKPSNQDMKKNPIELEEELLETNDCLTAEMIVPEGKRPRTERFTTSGSSSSSSPSVQHSEFCQKPFVLTPCKNYSFLLHGSVKSDEDQSKITENDVKLKPLPSLGPVLTPIRGGLDSICGSTNVEVSVKALCGSVDDTDADKDMEFVDELAKEELDSNQSPIVPSYESNAQMINVPIVFSNLKDAKTSEEITVSVPLVPSDIKVAKSSLESNVFPSQSDNRLLKYTFQRKHKKEAVSSSDNNASGEKNKLKRKAEEKPED